MDDLLPGMLHLVRDGGETLTRQLTKQVRLLLKYTYFNYTDQTSGGHNNYQAHSIFSSLQFRF